MPRMVVTMGECLAFPDSVTTDDSPLIPEGDYQMTYARHSTYLFMGRQPKVAVYFRIVEPGDYYELVLPAYYNVKEFIGKRGKSGRFRAAKKSNLARDYCRVFPNDSFPRLDRLPMSNMASVLILGTVRTVQKDALQRDIPEAVRYSKVLTIELFQT